MKYRRYKPRYVMTPEEERKEKEEKYELPSMKYEGNIIDLEIVELIHKIFSYKVKFRDFDFNKPFRGISFFYGGQRDLVCCFNWTKRSLPDKAKPVSLEEMKEELQFALCKLKLKE